MMTFLILMRIDRPDGVQDYITKSRILVLKTLDHSSSPGDKIDANQSAFNEGLVAQTTENESINLNQPAIVITNDDESTP